MTSESELKRGGEFQQREHPGYLDNIVELIRNKPSEFNIPNIVGWDYVLKGVIHHVFELHTETGEKLYLKARADKFSGLPQFACEPQDIIYEYKATKLLNSIMPNIFPQVVFFDPERAFLILTDVLSGSITLDDLLNDQQNIDYPTASTLGAGLRFIHDQMYMLASGVRIRDDSEDNFFKTKIEQKFRHWSHPVFDHAKLFLETQAPRQLVIGDLLPKNIGVNKKSGDITIFDLEDVHQGSVDFELGYLLGHIILHINDPQKAGPFLDAFFDGYDGDHNQRLDWLEKTITLASIVHRLHSIAPYGLETTEIKKKKILINIELLLKSPTLEVTSWQQLTSDVLKE